MPFSNKQTVLEKVVSNLVQRRICECRLVPDLQMLLMMKRGFYRRR